MFENESYIRMFTDMMSEGFIFIDNKGIIQIYNNKAKEIFGIVYNQGISHNSGKIEKGDIVIIVDNCLGKDDGNLTPKALEIIGIIDKNIEIGDAIIAIGVYKDKKISPIYKYKKNKDIKSNLILSSNYLNICITASIDFNNKILLIQVGKESYPIQYINAIGHMVVLDGNNKKMKFYQSHGYTARREGIYDLLKGRPYRAKGENAEDFDVIGKDIFEIHKGGTTIQEFYGAATGKDISYIDEFKEINGRPTICTLTPVNKDGRRVGAALRVEDISEIKKAIQERDEALLNLEQMEKRLNQEEDSNNLFPQIIGDSNEIQNVKKLAFKASKTNSNVLILGESGTGKSLLAEAIHMNSNRSKKPFIHVNCGSIPSNLLESELFGYEKGAFTGAKDDGKLGMFELANGGTIFLDEIGEIPLQLQVKLLQVLQDKSFYKIGGKKKITVDVRIIAATNKNLEEEMINGRFREDLYYRINVFPIWIPPLRDRKQDIYSLVQTMLPSICKRIGCKNKRISGEALNILTKYNWPGNIRELENILERAVNIADGNTILSRYLAIKEKICMNDDNNSEIKPLSDIVKEAEKLAIEQALHKCKGNKKLAMKILGISKTTLYEKIKKYNIKSNSSG